MAGKEWQRQFFDSPQGLARREHPLTSHEAAHEMVATGEVGRMEQVVLGLLQETPGATGRELDEALQSASGAAHKRLDGLRRKGLVRSGEARKCIVSGRMATTWWTTEW